MQPCKRSLREACALSSFDLLDKHLERSLAVLVIRFALGRLGRTFGLAGPGGLLGQPGGLDLPLLSQINAIRRQTPDLPGKNRSELAGGKRVAPQRLEDRVLRLLDLDLAAVELGQTPFLHIAKPGLQNGKPAKTVQPPLHSTALSQPEKPARKTRSISSAAK